MERGVVVNKALEEFERLLRWDELCALLRELYYKYLDLAAFRSEKCFFPGRRCKRPWKREYDIGDLALMWTYILNTAPLCGKLMRALAEVEYKLRLRALESLEKYGGVEKMTNPSGEYKIVNVRLERPVHGYLALRDDKLYVIWGEFDGLSKDGKKRATEIERRVLDVIERYKRGERVEVEVEEYEIDREYERLWLEVPLPQSASKLLGGKGKAPVALFRNLGWLLSDDSRRWIAHLSGNPGQIAVRIFDWIAIAKYAVDIANVLQSNLLVFKLTASYVNKTKDGFNSHVEVRAISTTAKIIRIVYEQFGMALNGTKEVLARGYSVLKALREEAFKRDGKVYVVDDVGAWIAFSATVTALVLGDGYVTPFTFAITTKLSPRMTFEGETTEVEELAKVISGTTHRHAVHLRGWHMRLLLPVPLTLAFEKIVKLYEALANYPAVAVVEINGVKYLLSHCDNGQFKIGKERAIGLYEVIKRLGLRIGVRKDGFVLLYTQLRELVKHNIPVRLLSELDKDSIKEVKPLILPDLEALWGVLEEIAKVARTAVGLHKGREYVRIILYDKSKLEEAVAALKAAGIRLSVCRSRGWICIYDRRSVEAIRRIMPHLFSHRPLLNGLLLAFMQ